MSRLPDIGPDLALVGAARSGTSFLAAALSRHPRIDPGALKEPDYYSIRWGESPEWYDQLFHARSQELLRLDASVSYTYPQHPMALNRLLEHAPQVRVVYVVREPVARLVSHYQLLRYYSGQKDLGTLGDAISLKDMFVGSGDYAHWLDRLCTEFSPERVLVVPFPVVTQDIDSAVSEIVGDLGLGAWTPPPDENPFRNDVRAFRHPAVRAAQRRLHRGRVYPAVRRAIGAERLRRLRSVVTKPVTLPPRAEEVESLSPEQRARVADVSARAKSAVSVWLVDQDRRRGLSWAEAWAAHVES